MMARAQAGPRGISEAAVRAKTGKGWEEWYAILDAWKSPGKGHTAIARYLREHQAVSPWWAQAVTVRYEWERGLRAESAE